MTTHESQLESDLAKLAIHNYASQSYSPSAGKKIGPAVPPKPSKKAPEVEDQPIYANCGNLGAKPGPQQPIYSNYVSNSEGVPQPSSPYSGVSGGGSPSGMVIARGSMHPPPTDLSGHHQHAMSHQPPPASLDGSSTYATFRPDSSASSYDSSSIYEPINPRPASQMSNRSNYSMASGGGSSLYSSYYPQVGGRGRGGTLTRPHGKEAEVDHLTDLLVQSMDNSVDPDFYGMCHKCGEKVLGEGSGCTAMSQVYHIACFSCHICQKELRGKPFFAMDGLPYCEEDYLNTLEKCCVCWKPILDRILRATGKPYHPGCFSCVVCGKCLDGIPFTVDATNQIHCIDDFHKKFAPRCCVCNEPIMPEAGQDETVRVVALDRSFHVGCYRCEDCGMQLSSEAEGRGCYPMDDHILCRSCNAKRVQAISSSVTTEL